MSIIIPKSPEACTPAHGQIEVSPETDFDGDLLIKATEILLDGNTKTVMSWLDRDGVRTLRDHLTGILGEKEEAPTGGVWSLGRLMVPPSEPTLDDRVDSLPFEVVERLMVRLSEVGK